MATFKEKLVSLRKARGLTQEKAARRMGLKRATLNGYENGTRTPGYDLAIKICRFYNVPFDYFADEPEQVKEVTVEDVAARSEELGVTLTQLSAASGISYNTVRQAVKGASGRNYLSQGTLRRLMDTLDDFDFSVFPNYRQPSDEEEESV